MHRPSAIVLLLVSAVGFGCGGRVQSVGAPADPIPPSECVGSDCSSPPAQETPPPADTIRTPDPYTGVGTPAPDASAAPETGPAPEAGGSPRPDGPCPPPETVLAGAPCQAGPQTCPGHPTPCDGDTFYDALVCAEGDDAGVWLWQSVAVTVCGDPGSPDADTDAATAPPDASASLDPATPVHAMGTCVPWSSVRGEAFVEADAGQSLATLTATTAEMVGSFVGHATSPWGEWDVLITFTADGAYVASAYNGTAPGGTPPPFYYGAATGCESLQRWRLLDVAVTGAVSGQLDVPFSYGAQGCALPGWQGLLSEVSFDPTGDRLQFHFGTSDGYGPIVYDLWRRC